MTELLYKDITYDIRGACFWVWKEFRGAFKESVIDKSLTIELKKRGHKIEDQKRIDVYYGGSKVGTYIPDKIVDGKVLVELKCKEFLTQQDIDQFWKYLKGSHYKLGLLINFGPKKLDIRRVVYDEARVVKDLRFDPRQRSALRSAEEGFATLVSVLLVGVIGLAISVSLLLLGLSSSRTSFAREQSYQAKALADACAEEALQQIHDSGPFTGSGTLTLGQGSCSYTVTSQGGANRTIIASGTVATMTRRVRIVINQINPTIGVTSWQEVADF